MLNQKRAVVNFFNYLVDVAKVIPTNQLSGIKKRSLPKALAKEIAFLTLAEASRYVRAMQRYDQELIAHEVVQLFSGVRADDEMADFRGEFVKAGTREIVIPAEVAKMERREVIGGLEDNFWDWWATYGREGLLRPKNYLQRWHRVRVLAAVEDRDKPMLSPAYRSKLCSRKLDRRLPWLLGLGMHAGERFAPITWQNTKARTGRR